MPNVVSHAQALAAGLTPGTVRARLDSGRWQRLHRGVFAAHSGPITRSDLILGVLLAAGSGATLSHATAAELSGLVDVPTAVIHVTVPELHQISGIMES